MENEQCMYVLTYLTLEHEMIECNRVLGVFTTFELAAKALDDTFHRECDILEITELNDYSYYTEGDSFNIIHDVTCYEANCEIQKVQINKCELNN